MVQRELRIRYKNSVLGFLWSMLNPLITVMVMTFMFVNFLHKDTPSASAYILAAYLPFTFFQMCLMDSSQSILAALPLLKKVYLPREILPMASVISNFIHLLMAFAMFFVYLLLVFIIHPGSASAPREWPFQATTLFLPLLLLINLMLSLGLSFYISALNTFYEDVKYIVMVVMYLMFFMCPIIYFEEDVAYSHLNVAWHGLLYNAMNLNPIFALCNAYRKLLIAPARIIVDGKSMEPTPFNWSYLLIASVFSVVVLVHGYSTFNKLKWRFVERP